MKLTFPCIILKNGQTYLLNETNKYTKQTYERHLKYFWPFFNITLGKVNSFYAAVDENLHFYRCIKYARIRVFTDPYSPV